MAYKPMTADEAAKLSLRPEGVYAFEVVTAEDKNSAAGNPMIALELNFFDESGDRFSVKDWLVHSDSRWTEKKFFDFANTTGLTGKYQQGTLCADDCLGRGGYAKIGVEKGKQKPDAGDCFPDKNKVAFYTSKPAPAKRPEPTEAQMANLAPPPAKKAPVENLDEDVPF